MKRYVSHLLAAVCTIFASACSDPPDARIDVVDYPCGSPPKDAYGKEIVMTFTEESASTSAVHCSSQWTNIFSYKSVATPPQDTEDMVLTGQRIVIRAVSSSAKTVGSMGTEYFPDLRISTGGGEVPWTTCFSDYHPPPNMPQYPLTSKEWDCTFEPIAFNTCGQNVIFDVEIRLVTCEEDAPDELVQLQYQPSMWRVWNDDLMIRPTSGAPYNYTDPDHDLDVSPGYLDKPLYGPAFTVKP